MASESLAPPPASGGGGFAKYLIILLLLAGGGLGVYFATSKPAEPPKPVAPPEPVKTAERSTALSNDTLEIPDEEVEDAGVEEAQPPPKKPGPKGPAVDPWACQGDLSPNDIRKVLADSQAQIRSCYERRLRNDNQLQGSVNLQVKIGNDGKVANTRIRGTLRDNEVRNCMQNLAKKWSFPPPSGGNCAVFDAPYNFTPKM